MLVRIGICRGSRAPAVPTPVRSLAVCPRASWLSAALTSDHLYPQDLRFPLSIVLAHLTIKFLLAAAVRNYLECTYNTQRTTLPWRLYWSKMAAPGVFSALDIGLSQWSFEFITVTLYTMTKSTSVIFIYMCALFLRIEKLVSD